MIIIESCSDHWQDQFPNIHFVKSLIKILFSSLKLGVEYNTSVVSKVPRP